jgi:hypothetical protein
MLSSIAPPWNHVFFDGCGRLPDVFFQKPSTLNPPIVIRSDILPTSEMADRLRKVETFFTERRFRKR